MSLLLLVMASMMTFFAGMQRNTAKQEQRAHAADAIRGAIERVAKDVRQAEDVNTGSGASLLSVDTYVDGVETTVVYSASGGTLTRTIGANAQPILGNLASTAVFTYTPSVTSPTLIQISISAYPYPVDTTTTVTITSDVRLRNR